MGLQLLKKMCWKSGRVLGTGVKYKQKKKKIAKNRNLKTLSCALKPQSDTEPEDENVGEFTFAPDDVDSLQCKRNDNVVGLGFSGLGKLPLQPEEVSLLGPEPMKSNKKRKITTHDQAFGVGAALHKKMEDKDIYHREDMSHCDFMLDDLRSESKKSEDSGFCVSLQSDDESEDENEKELTFAPDDVDSMTYNPKDSVFGLGYSEPDTASTVDHLGKMLEGFRLATNQPSPKKHYPLPLLPQNFNPFHQASSSSAVAWLPYPSIHKGMNLQVYSAKERDILLGEKTLPHAVATIPPAHLTEWEKVREREEFTKAAQLYHPLTAGIASQFVFAKALEEEDGAGGLAKPQMKMKVDEELSKLDERPSLDIYRTIFQDSDDNDALDGSDREPSVTLSSRPELNKQQNGDDASGQTCAGVPREQVEVLSKTPLAAKDDPLPKKRSHYPMLARRVFASLGLIKLAKPLSRKSSLSSAPEVETVGMPAMQTQDMLCRPKLPPPDTNEKRNSVLIKSKSKEIREKALKHRHKKHKEKDKHTLRKHKKYKQKCKSSHKSKKSSEESDSDETLQDVMKWLKKLHKHIK